MQLQTYADQFADAGVAIAVITYDTPMLQQAFIDKYDITFALLSDLDAVSVKNLGLLNEDYAPGDTVYGIPHPGVLVIDTNHDVVGKAFLQSYQKRVDAPGVLQLAIKSLNGGQ